MIDCLSAIREIERKLAGARRVLIASDFDGTLSPIAESPAGVQVAPEMLDILRRMASCAQLELAIISGRDISDVSSRVPLPVTFAGNHGMEIRGDGFAFVHPGARALRPRLAAAVDSLAVDVSRWSGAWVEDKGLTATVHYRAVRSSDQLAVEMAVRERVARLDGPFVLGEGKKALEIRPDVDWDKGAAFKLICEQRGPFDLCIALGDDRTDESMFRANPGQINIKVGEARPTEANCWLADPVEVAVFLAYVVQVVAIRQRLFTPRVREIDFAIAT